MAEGSRRIGGRCSSCRALVLTGKTPKSGLTSARTESPTEPSNGNRSIRNSFLPRLGSSPVRMDPDVNPQDEKQHRRNTTRRSSQVPRDEFEGPPAPFKPLCPAKPSPSFLELPSNQWRPSPSRPYTQMARIGKGKRHSSPEHQPQECFGLLECIHNNIQVQTQIAQTQLSLLEDMRETMNILLYRQEQQSHESAGQPEQRTQKGSVSSPIPSVNSMHQ